MEEEEGSSTTVESRDEFMVSPSNETKAFIKRGHFLKPPKHSIKYPPFDLLLKPLDPKKYNFNVAFSGWTVPTEKWVKWVDKMASIHSLTWKKAGIYEAIMSSKCRIDRNNELVYKLAEKWCPQTSSFIFPWGEVTITLEDMEAFGFSALGYPVFSSLETEEFKAIEERLENARIGSTRSAAQKALTSSWMTKFMDGESGIEHEAFLALWLSRYVLANARCSLRKHTFPFAVRLARGIRVALGPAVLASIYRDLKLLRKRIVMFANSESNQMDSHVSPLGIKSPFHLVQIWAWERFAGLCPQPRVLYNGEPRLARWNKLRRKFEKVNFVLDSANATFKWRPYVETIENWTLPMVYRDNSTWVTMDSGVHEEFVVFAECLRVSSLIGVECRENYYPHRVAMQFGFDQDQPGFADQFGEIDDSVGRDYDRLVDGMKLYVPSRFDKGHVTVRYREWWKQWMLKLQNVNGNAGQRQRSLMPSRTESEVMKHKTSRKNVVSSLKMKPKISKTRRASEYLTMFKREAKTNNSPVALGFPPKSNIAEACNSNSTPSKDNMTINSSSSYHEKHASVHGGGDRDVQNLSGKSQSQAYASATVVEPREVAAVELIIIEDDNESVNEVHRSEASKNSKLSDRDSTALDQPENQPTTVDSCAVKDMNHLNRSIEDVKQGADMIFTSDENDEYAHSGNAESEAYSHASPMDGRSNKMFEDIASELEARVSKLEQIIPQIKAAIFG